MATRGNVSNTGGAQRQTDLHTTVPKNKQNIYTATQREAKEETLGRKPPLISSEK
jgi:hypothetical protein